MKKNVNLALALILVVVVGCSKDDNETKTLQSELTRLENSIDHTILIKSEYTLETIKNSKNEYGFYGEKLLNSIDALFIFATENSSSPTLKQDMESFVQEEVSKVNPSNIEFNMDEEALFDSFINKAMSSTDPISVAMEYENFVIENYQDQSLVGNFLIVISEYKYAEFARRKRTLAQIEACADNCMRDNYASYGVVRWLLFATNPGADVLGNYAACIEDCL